MSPRPVMEQYGQWPPTANLVALREYRRQWENAPYPPTFVTVPRAFSQSYLSFVALSSALLENAGPFSRARARDQTIGHELWR